MNDTCEGCTEPATKRDVKGVPLCAECYASMMAHDSGRDPAPALPTGEARPTCRGCGNEIDPDCCHCGDGPQYHDSWEAGHPFIPMGCVCGYAKPPAPAKPAPPVEPHVDSDALYVQTWRLWQEAAQERDALRTERDEYKERSEYQLDRAKKAETERDQLLGLFAKLRERVGDGELCKEHGDECSNLYGFCRGLVHRAALKSTK